MMGTSDIEKRYMMWWCILGNSVDTAGPQARSEHVRFNMRSLGEPPSEAELTIQRIELFDL